MIHPKICILLAAYNGADYIEEQIDSIQKQSLQSTIYIRVDKSSDQTFSVVTKYQERYPNIQLLAYGESSGSAGQNFFRLLVEVDFSKYDYIAFADQDDRWYQNKLERAIEQMNIQNAAGYSSNVMAFWADGRRKLIKKDYPQARYDHFFESAGPGCTFVMTRELALAIKHSLIAKREHVKGLWLHDWYCYAFARANGYAWFIDNEPTMDYRQHDANQVGANSGLPALKVRVKSITSGDGFAKVLAQSTFLEKNSHYPIKLLSSSGRLNSLRLAFLAQKCRRRPLDKAYFFCAFILFAIIGTK